MTGPDARLLPLWRAVHDRLSAGGPVSSVRVGAWTAQEREAVADLLGLDRVPAPGGSLSMAALQRAVCDGTDDSHGNHDGAARLRAVVEGALGPLGDRRSELSALRADRAALWAWLEGHPVVRAEPALQDWVAQLRRAGLIGGSVPTTRALLERALAVLAAIPGEGIGLPVFADRVLHDPHALDEGHRLATTVLQALCCLTGTTPHDAADRRAVWQRLGVETDALSSTVLVAGLRARSRRAAGARDHAGLILAACADAGDAAVLTLAQVRTLVGHGETALAAAHDVHVVENPSVTAAALARFGVRCPPLVCTSGWPSTAGMLLLRALAAGGARLHYHGDLDGDGLRIAAHLVARTGAVPWRMTRADYELALARRPAGPPAGRISDVPWDAGLGPALRASGVTVTEEAVIDDLLGDLERFGPE
jgi:uncharacterized protein (TIGR02679 family)